MAKVKKCTLQREREREREKRKKVCEEGARFQKVSLLL